MRAPVLLVGMLMLLATAVNGLTDATCPKKCIGPRGA